MSEFNKPVREEENKVVMAKLPREEFANFKQLCDIEDKTVNKKLRELVQQEIDRKNKKPGFVKAGGSMKRFFLPSENKFLEMIEVRE
jgi:hypothetical protein